MIEEFKALGLKPLNVAIVIAGTGTDMKAVLEAAEMGCIPEMGNCIVIGTKKEAKGLVVAERRFGLDTFVVNKLDEQLFHIGMTQVLVEQGIDVVFMLGNHRYVYPIVICGNDLETWQAAHAAPIELQSDFLEIPNFNIHPALPEKHGGTEMCGLEVHIHVLEELLDEVRRHGYDPRKRYLTTIVVHRAHKESFTEKPTIVYGQKKFDIGAAFTTQNVVIPNGLIEDLQSEVAAALAIGDEERRQHYRGQAIEKYAARLQQHVLRYEWRLLPSAMRSIAWEVITERYPKYDQLLKKWAE